MELKQLEYFLAVAECGSFTNASVFLSIAQSALSKHIRALELELRQSLFVRTGRGVTLTPAGKRLVEHSQGLFQQIERLRSDVKHERDAVSGRVVVGLPPSVGYTITTRFVRVFRERFPHAQLNVVEALSTYLLEWLSVGRIDIAVVYNAAPSTAFDLSPVLEEPLYLVSPSYDGLLGALATVTLEEVAKCPLVVPGRTHSRRALLETAMAAAGLRPNVVVEVESISAILELVECDGLHAVLPLGVIKVRAGGTRVTWRRIGTPSLATRLSLALSVQHLGSTLVTRTTETLRELLVSNVCPFPNQ